MQILATKLYSPPPRPGLVLRPRLLQKLNDGLHRRLTIISAPAGFGKTTVAGEWIAGCKKASAWLSLDKGDSELARFLMYLIASLQTLRADIGAKTLVVLQTAPQSPTELLLTSLINEMNAMPFDFILVLDDYHAVDAKPVDNALAFILDHLPPQMHLVITTREDPDLPLAKWRARGQMAELRAADLRFTGSEATEFFNKAMGLDLAEKDIAALENRTEGWIVGLQMAALSLQGRADTAGFIKAFSGSHRFVLDYLLEEVLQCQPECVQEFLMQTAILEGLCSSLCDAVTGRNNGTEMLEALENGNLFIVSLDDQRNWYRYHHLFADVLRVHLIKVEPDRVAVLHRRASHWYEQNDMPAGAIFHALAANDFERAAGLIELAGPTMEGGSQSAEWLGWVEALPDELIRNRPVLSTWYAFALLAGAEMEAAEARLKDAERWIENPSAGMVVTDQRQLRSLPGTLAIARAYFSQTLGDGLGTVRYARQALDILPEGEHIRCQQATGLLGMACWASGDLESAGRVFADYHLKLQTACNIPDSIGTAFVLADIRMAQGHLKDAASTLGQSLQFVIDRGKPLPPDTAELYRGFCELYRERGELDSALRYLSESKELDGRSELLGQQHRLLISEALMKQSLGDLDGALDLLYEAEHLYLSSPLPVVRPIAALRARIWVAQDKLKEAMNWICERGLSIDDELSYLHEFEHLTVARVLFACYKRDADESIHVVMGFLERLRKAAEEGGRTSSVIEILVLQALAHSAMGDIQSAVAVLERALILAEPEGYVRIFIDEGQSMVELLTMMNASHRSITPGMESYIHELLAAFKRHPPSMTMKGNYSAPTGSGLKPLTQPPLSQALLEPLSQRELEVLCLVGQGLSNQEIGERLFLALDTIKGHNRRIFDKLDVKRRTEALARARELGLL